MGPVRLDDVFMFPMWMDSCSNFILHRHQPRVGTLCPNKDTRIQTGRYYNSELHERLPRRNREFIIFNIYPQRPQLL